MPVVSLRSNKGSTLFEVLTASVIASLIAVSIIALLIGGMNGWSRGTSKAYAETSSSIATQKLAQEIRDGQSAVVSNGTLIVTFPVESVDANGERCYQRGVAGQVRSYYIPADSNTLKRNIGGNESVVLDRVSDVVFAVSGPNVTIAVTGVEQVGKYSADDETVSRVRLRNFKS